MTSFERKILLACERALLHERKNLKRFSELTRFAGNELGLKLVIGRHRSNIAMYEKLIADLRKRGR